MSQNGRTTAVLTARLVPVQQLGNGKMGVVEYARLMLPHKLVDGKCFGIDGEEMKDIPFEGKEDCIIIDEKYFAQKMVTQAWRNNIVAGINHNLLGSASNQAEAEAEPEPETDEPETDEPEQEGFPEFDKAIEKGKFKKAKKLLEALGEDHPLYKQYKKILKKASK